MREREKIDQEHKDSTNITNDAKKRRSDNVDGVALWPNRRAGHNSFFYKQE